MKNAQNSRRRESLRLLGFVSGADFSVNGSSFALSGGNDHVTAIIERNDLLMSPFFKSGG